MHHGGEGSGGDVTLFGAPCSGIHLPFSYDELRQNYLGCQNLPTAIWIMKLKKASSLSSSSSSSSSVAAAAATPTAGGASSSGSAGVAAALRRVSRQRVRQNAAEADVGEDTGA
jgi:hypothetical protein